MPALALLAAAAISGSPLSGPLAPAAEGKVQCILPDAASKTCLGVAGYRFERGKVIGWTKVVASRGGLPITMEVEEAIKIKDGQVCNSDRSDAAYQKIRFTVGDRPATPQEAQLLREMLKEFNSWMREGESCTEIVERNGILFSLLHAPGQKGEMAQKFSWITPGTGYRLATW